MKRFLKRNALSLLLGLSLSCEMHISDDDYVHLGHYESKIEAQNEAMGSVLGLLNSPPKADFHKVLYTFGEENLYGRNKHAIWYSQKMSRLGLETDISSGMLCIWDNVDVRLLRQMVNAKQGLAGIDSLLVPPNKFTFCEERFVNSSVDL